MTSFDGAQREHRGWPAKTNKHTTTMIALNSSAIVAADYDPASRHLYLWFPNNGPYTFYRVPEHIFRGLITASSAGSYYNSYIRRRYAA